MKIVNKGGRPPKGQMTRTARINMRAEPSEKARYEQAAKRAGLALTEWMAERLNRAAKRELRS